MNTISKAQLQQLVNAADDDFVSLYMPTYPVGEQGKQNPIRFRKLLCAAEETAIERGIDAAGARDLLAPACELLDRLMFWQALDRGIAALVAHDGLRVWHMSSVCEELCVVGRRFHITPLLAWAAGDLMYFVLAVSQNKVRLLRGTRDRLTEVDVPGLPTNLTEALGYHEPEGMFQTHSGQPQLHGKEGLVFHGQGGAPDEAKQDLASYFRQIDGAVSAYLRLTTEPLLFAGVDYLFPIYRDVNGYPHLFGTHISGNPDLAPLADLKRKAWSLVEALNRQRRDAAIKKYWDLVASHRTSNRIQDIVMAAHAGAVDTLFIDPLVRRLGEFDPSTNEVQLHELPRRAGEDLVNLAATLVLHNRGTVEPVGSQNIPGGGVMAAVMRYPFEQ